MSAASVATLSRNCNCARSPFKLPTGQKCLWQDESLPASVFPRIATRKIRKGTVIVEYKGQRTDWKEAMSRPDSDPDDAAHTFLFELNDGRVIDARVRGNAARWINHSCDPNCRPFEDEEGRVFIQARRKILGGEELAYDYKLQFDGRMSKRQRQGFACHCGSPRCRGTLLEMLD